MVRGLATALGLCLLAGCHAAGRWPAAFPLLEQSLLEQGPRRNIEVEVPRLDMPPPTAPAVYRYLTAEECRRRAFVATPLADFLSDPFPETRRYKHDGAELWVLIRAWAADELRNRQIAEALSDFYRLAAVEGQWDLLQHSEQILQQQKRSLEAAVQQGVRPPQELLSLEQQLLENRSRQAQLAAARQALNAALAERLGLPTDDPPLWPQTVLRLDPRDFQVEAALHIAEMYRPDLNLLRLLMRLDGRALARASGVLQAVHPLLGDEPTPPPLHLLFAQLHKVPAVSEQRWRLQVEAALEARRRQASAEVRAAIAQRQGYRAQAMARQAEVDFWQQQQAELEKRQAVGQAVASELLAARLAWLRARADLLQTVADWHRADVQLRQALGLLVRE